MLKSVFLVIKNQITKNIIKPHAQKFLNRFPNNATNPINTYNIDGPVKVALVLIGIMPYIEEK